MEMRGIWVGMREIRMEMMGMWGIRVGINYCPLVWFVSSSISLRKIENLHKRALRFLLNDYVSSYEQSLQKSSEASINLRNHGVFAMKFLKQ